MQEETFVPQWGSAGSGSGQFSGLAGVATDGSRNVYVADLGNYVIQKFDASGTFLTAWYDGGGAGLATDRIGHVYVADSGNNFVQKYRLP